MKKFKSLVGHLSEHADLKERYPNLGKTIGQNILFVSPFLNGDGLYKMLIPAIELDQHPNFNVIVSDIIRYVPGMPNHEYEIDLEYDLIMWADHIVFPFMTYDMTETIKNIRYYNPAVEIVFHIDHNFASIPDYHPDKALDTKEVFDAIIENMRESNLVLTSNNVMNHVICGQLKDYLKGSMVDVMNMPLLLSQYCWEGIDPQKKKSKEKDVVRIGLVGNQYDYEDYKTLIPVLEHLEKTHKGKYELVVFGYKGRKPTYNGEQKIYTYSEESVLDNFDFHYTGPTNPLKYFSKLAFLDIDIALIPSTTDDYSKSSKNYIKYLEFSYLGIPTIAQNLTVLSSVIKEGNGFLCNTTEEWTNTIDLLMKDKELMKKVGKNANEVVTNEYMFNQNRIEGVYKMIFPAKQKQPA